MEFNPDLFVGFNGSTSGLVATVKSEYVDAVIWPNHIGCTLTHLAFYKALSILNICEPVAVFEDDARINTRAFDLESIIDNARFEYGWEPRIYNIGAAFTEDKPKEQVNGTLWDVKWPLCTHAMVIEPEAIPILANWTGPIREQIDVWYWSLFKSGAIKPYCILPRLAEQFETPLPI